MIPLYHDFSDAVVLVVGGGPVGARKARRFASEARVLVLSPRFDDAFKKRSFPDVERLRAAPAADDAAGWLKRVDPALVVAATDDEELNAALARAADERGVLYNRADRSGSRDADSVVVPATVEEPPVSVAVSTGARSPALAAFLRERIEAEIEGAGAMAELTADLRAELKTGSLSAAERREALRAVVRSPSVWKALHTPTANAQKEAERAMDECNMDDDRGERR